jgi:hypothetical protein
MKSLAIALVALVTLSAGANAASIQKPVGADQVVEWGCDPYGR